MPLGEAAIDRCGRERSAPGPMVRLRREAPDRAPNLRTAPARWSHLRQHDCSGPAPDAAIMADAMPRKRREPKSCGHPEKFEECALRVHRQAAVFAAASARRGARDVRPARRRAARRISRASVRRPLRQAVDRMLPAIGLNPRTTASIANLIRGVRPARHRTPTPQEEPDLPAVHAAPDRTRQSGPCWSGLGGRPRPRCLAFQGMQSIARARALVSLRTAGSRRIRSIASSIRPICCARRWESGSRARLLAIRGARTLPAVAREPSHLYVLY